MGEDHSYFNRIYGLLMDTRGMGRSVRFELKVNDDLKQKRHSGSSAPSNLPNWPKGWGMDVVGSRSLAVIGSASICA